MNNKKLKVVFLGFRGFPNVQGGIETHVEHLAPLLVDLGCDVEAIVRSNYHDIEKGDSWQGVKYTPISSLNSKGLEAIVHTFLGVLYAAIKRPDILHIQAIGPALLVPLARLLGLKVVITHHGPDYDRQKWGRIAKLMLKLGEKFGAVYSNKVIVISKTIKDIVKNKYNVESTLIPNGVTIQKNIFDEDNTLPEFGLNKGRYIIIVSRLVPEKRHLDLIEAFKKAELSEWKLVIVGSTEHPDEYSEKVLLECKENDNIISTGFMSGSRLKAIFSHAGLFVLPSSHEGLPIALLEALSYGLNTLVSDIPANLEVGLPDHNYFELGNIEQLKTKLIESTSKPMNEADAEQIVLWTAEKYNWNDVARKTFDVYKSLI